MRTPIKTARLVVANPENLKMQRKMQMPKITNGKCKKNATSNVAFSPLHFFLQLATLHFLRCIFFATLINFCIFYEKKQKCNDTKTNATENAKKCNFQRCIFWVAFFLQLATSHFLSCFFSFSKLATLHFLICLYLESSSNKQHI